MNRWKHFRNIASEKKHKSIQCGPHGAKDASGTKWKQYFLLLHLLRATVFVALCWRREPKVMFSLPVWATGRSTWALKISALWMAMLLHVLLVTCCCCLLDQLKDFIYPNCLLSSKITLLVVHRRRRDWAMKLPSVLGSSFLVIEIDISFCASFKQ